MKLIKNVDVYISYNDAIENCIPNKKYKIIIEYGLYTLHKKICKLYERKICIKNRDCTYIFENGLLHDNDNPAFISDHYKIWYYKGQTHRCGLNAAFYNTSKYYKYYKYYKNGKRYELWQLRNYGRIILRCLLKNFNIKKKKALLQALLENNCIIFPGLIDLIV